MFDEGWQRSEIDQKHITAHEFFHLAQRLVVPRVTCRSAWWVEGSADWFANRVVPGSTWSEGWLSAFDEESGGRSLLDMTYETQAFFYWIDDRYGDTLPMTYAEFGDEGLSDPAAVGSHLPPEAWQEFLETYLSGHLRYPDGRLAIPEPSLGPVISRPWRLSGPPLSFPRSQIELEPGDWRLDVQSNSELLGVRVPDQTWRRVETQAGQGSIEHTTKCPDPEKLVVAAVSLNGPDLAASVVGDLAEEEPCNCSEPPPTDHCLVGTWQVTSTDLPSTFNRVQSRVGGPSRWRGQDMGRNRITLGADGRFEQVFSNTTTSQFKHQIGDVPATQTVTISNSAIGRWSAPEPGRAKICKTEFKGEMTNELRIGSDVSRSGPNPIPYDAGREHQGFDHTYACTASSATVTLHPEFGQPVTWTMERMPRPTATAPP